MHNFSTKGGGSSYSLSARISPETSPSRPYTRNFTTSRNFINAVSPGFSPEFSQTKETKLTSLQSPFKMKLRKVIDDQKQGPPPLTFNANNISRSAMNTPVSPVHSPQITANMQIQPKMNKLFSSPSIEGLSPDWSPKSPGNVGRPQSPGGAIFSLTLTNIPNVSKVHYRKEAWKITRADTQSTDNLTPVLKEEAACSSNFISNINKKISNKSSDKPGRVFNLTANSSPVSKNAIDELPKLRIDLKSRKKQKNNTMLALIRQEATSPKASTPFVKHISPQLSPHLSPVLEPEFHHLPPQLIKAKSKEESLKERFTTYNEHDTSQSIHMNHFLSFTEKIDEKLMTITTENSPPKSKDHRILKALTSSNPFMSRMEKQSRRETVKKEKSPEPLTQKIPIKEDLAESPLTVYAVQALNPVFGTRDRKVDPFQAPSNREIEKEVNVKPDIRTIRKKLTDALNKMKRLKISPKDLLNNEEVFSYMPYQKRGSKALIEAARLSNKETVEKILDKYGRFIVYDFDHIHQTALHWAVRKGNAEIVELLIEKGADVDAQDIAGRTPLYFALKHNYIRVLKILLANQAAPWSTKDCNYKQLTKNNPTASHYLNRARQLHTLMSMTLPKKRKAFWDREGPRLIVNMDFNIDDLY